MNIANSQSIRRKKTQSDVRHVEVRQQLVNVLMNRPWITKQHDRELYALARDHYEALREWFHEQLGWSLISTRHFVKLEKIPGQFHPSMQFRGFRDPRDYGLFTYGLWYLEGLGDNNQFLLSEMVDAIREHLVGVDVQMDWTLYDHRLSMARALRTLRELDVLVAVDGDETDWARVGGDSNVLYEASPMARYVLRQFARDLMSYTTIEELIEPVDELQVRRHQVIRRLLEEPVVYDWQWTDEERRYVQTQRSSLIDRISEATGLQGRRFREGLLFTWTELSGEMDLFPTQAGISDFVVLFASELRRVLAHEPTRYDRDENQCLVLTKSELEALTTKLRASYGEYWSKEQREKTSRDLTDDLIAHLAGWNLGEDDGFGGVRLFPTIFRWIGDYRWEDENE